MRRSPLVIAGTLLGLAGVLNFHTAPATISLAGLSSTPSTTTTGGSTTSTSSTTTPASTTVAPTTTAPAKGRRSRSTTPVTTSPPATTSAPTTVAPTTTVPSAPTGTRSATGPLVNYNFGELSVTVTASGKKITAVAIGTLSDGGNFRSQSIDGMAIPILEQEAMSAQGATIQSVSGASWTSAGFTQSLQGALSKLGL
jgi:uncharacterized protein with FMN-binding domain